MKADKEALKLLAEKNDRELWAEIRKIADSKGYKLPDITPKHEDLEKVRGALRGTEKMSMTDAVRLLNSYKKKG